RVISSIHVDPVNAHHAWISYNGYNVNTPTRPGHVFEVTWSGAGPATWVDRSYNLPDFPITAVAGDDQTGDLYASSDFGVMRLANGSTTWTVAGSGMPMVEVAGLTIVPEERLLYAATHGRSAWMLKLP
ncbi:MAG: exo-alpha-sialidase, partial [Vicinamibacterales bacterium]